MNDEDYGLNDDDYGLTEENDKEVEAVFQQVNARKKGNTIFSERPMRLEKNAKVVHRESDHTRI